jgi:hypothetical protein
MESRSTFLHHLIGVILMWGHSRLGRPYRWSSTADDEGEHQLKQGLALPKVVGEIRFLPGEPAEVILSRKATRKSIGCPYRKPTQVDEKNILRRTCDVSFRNSAN